MKIFKELFLFSLICIFIITAVSFFIDKASKIREENTKTVSQEGFQCFKADVPAEANPYIGSSQSRSKDWLDGWMEAKLRSSD